MNLRTKLHWFIYPLFVLACARQTAPTGGPKDTIPPTLIRAYPTSDQTNYTEKKIELTFDEAIALNNPKEQIIIVPDVGKDFEAEAKKNKAILQFTNDLADNTTYSVNFRDAIQDITEKNPTPNLKLAFSTGNYIDSLSIAGKVYDLLKSKEIKDATVALYQNDTFNIFQHKPSYFTKTDAKGNFEIGNLKPGDYYVYAVEDRNKNLIVDSKSESYGFQVQKVNLTAKITDINIPIIRLDARPLKLTSARPSGTYFNIKTSKNLLNYKLKAIKGESLSASFGEDQANIRIYNPYHLQDSIAFSFSAIDSIDNSIDTTLYLKFTKRETKPEPFKATASDLKLTGTKGILTGKVTLTKPLGHINFDSIYYQIDSLSTIKLTREDISVDTSTNIISIQKTFDKSLLIKKPNISNPQTTNKPTQGIPDQASALKATPSKKATEYQLCLGYGAFISVELDSSAKAQINVKPTTLESSGIISVQIDTSEPHFLVELFSKDFKAIAYSADRKNPIFEDLDPGDYQIRLTIDKNQDGKWSPGNFFYATPPEPIIFYKNEKGQMIVNLKANWELGPLLIKY